MISRIIDHSAPAERLAAFRIAVGIFVVVYLIGRLPVFLALAHRPEADFEPVGLLAPFADPPRGAFVTGTIVVALVAGVCATVGWRYRPAIIVATGAVLFLMTLRSSWGQLLHFENLMVLQLGVLVASPAADAWSIDAARGDDGDGDCEPSPRYGWPLAVAALVTVVTYIVAGVAKLRDGGIDWIVGETLRNHIAYSAARLDVIGGTPPLFAEFAVRHAWVLPVFAFAAVVVELSAPVVFIGPRCRNVWVAAAWMMHAGIFATMSVGFPSPLFGLAFAPMFALERIVFVARRWWEDASPRALRG